MRDKKELSYEKIFAAVVAIVSMRVFVEWMVFFFPIQMNGFQDYVRFYLENLYYFLIVFLLGSVILSKLTKQSLRYVMTFGVKLYPVVILPPLIDRIFLGQTDGYFYGTLSNFFYNFFTVGFYHGDGSFGISVEILLALIAVFIYVWIKTRNILRAFMGVLSIHFLLSVISTPDLFFGEGGGDYTWDHFLPVYYFFPFIGLLMFFFYVYHKEKFWAIVKNTRFFRSLAFVVAVCFGAFVRSLYIPGIYNLNLIFSSLAIWFVWQFSVIVNDICDFDIDQISNQQRPLSSGAVSIEEYRLVGILLAFFALTFSVIVNLSVFVLVCVALLFSVLYSVPPIRLRNNFAGNVLMGCSVVVSFYVGFLSTSEAFFMTKPIFYLTLLFLYFTVVLTLAKDIKDIEGDKEQKISNLFTSVGKESGKKAMTALIFLTLNVPLLFTFNIFIIFLSLMAVYLYYRYENIESVYIIGLVITLIVVLFFKNHMIY